MPVAADSTFLTTALDHLLGKTMMSCTISYQTARKMAAVERMWCQYITPHLRPTMSQARNLWLERHYDLLTDVMFNKALASTAAKCLSSAKRFTNDYSSLD